MVGGVAIAGAAAAGGAAAAPGAAAGTPVVGASAQEIEDMRRELAMRKARLDSLQRALHENEARQQALGPAPAAAAAQAAPRMSSADSAARVAEIEAIRQELKYRKARLDSLQKEVNTLGRTKTAPVKSDTTQSKSGAKPPRGLR
jgi:chromosome segregation ATPase